MLVGAYCFPRFNQLMSSFGGLELSVPVKSLVASVLMPRESPGVFHELLVLEVALVAAEELKLCSSPAIWTLSPG